MMEQVNCNLCGSDKAELFLERLDRLHVSSEPFRYVRCLRCGLIYLNPRPTSDEIHAYYPNGYEAFESKEEGFPFRLGQRYRIKKRCWTVESMSTTKRGKLLDVGCARGDFLLGMKERGWEVWGVELSALAAQEARDRVGASVFHGQLEEANFPDAYFDVITLWDVLEHLFDPKASLREVNRTLDEDGLLVLGVPNLGSFDALIFGEAWIGWDAPRHLYAFPAEVMARLLTEAGFIILSRRCFYGGYGAFSLSLRFYLEKRIGRGERQGILFWLVRQRPLRYILWPYFRIAYSLGKGPTITYFCRKRTGA